MKVLQISKRGLPAEVIELADISEPHAPKAGGLLAAVKYGSHQFMENGDACDRGKGRAAPEGHTAGGSTLGGR
jgi:hypothetical protein